MKKSFKPYTVKLIACLLASLLLLFSFASCASKGKTLLTLDKDGCKVTFSVNFYELLLSRWKGSLVYSKETQNGYNAEQDEFYDIVHSFDGSKSMTLSEYYSDLILETCKTYAATLWLFETKGLSLSDEQVEEVDERMKDLLDAYGEGSKTKLNTILATYGVNYNLLREMYLMEMKVTAVQNALYGSEGSLLGADVKEAHLQENYVRFKQIFLPYYHYVYRTDKNGDEIYYLKDSETGAIAYDTVNGFTKLDENNIAETDVNGDDIYYTSKEYTKIAYNKDEAVSTRSYVLDSEGNGKTTEMTKEEIDAVKAKGAELYASLQGKSVAEFETVMAKENKDGGEEIYPDGYYLQKDLDYAAMGTDVAYFSEIITDTEAIQAGEIAEIISDPAGYHIIMKYDATPKAYEDPSNEVWFQRFTSSLIQKLFLAECQSLHEYIEVNEKVLASASDIKKLGANFNY